MNENTDKKKNLKIRNKFTVNFTDRGILQMKHMVKYYFFIVGLTVLIGGFFILIVGTYNFWFYGEFRVGLVTGVIDNVFAMITLWVLGLFFLWLFIKIKRDEQEGKI